MINIIYILAFTQVLTGIGMVVLGIILLMMKHEIKKLKRDDQLTNAIRKYDLRWGEWK